MTGIQFSANRQRSVDDLSICQLDGDEHEAGFGTLYDHDITIRSADTRAAVIYMRCLRGLKRLIDPLLE